MCRCVNQSEFDGRAEKNSYKKLISYIIKIYYNESLYFVEGMYLGCKSGRRPVSE